MSATGKGAGRLHGWAWLAALLAIGAATAWAYADAAGFGFLLGDDQRHIRDNPHVHGLSAANLLWMFATAEIDYWRPLSFLTHALDYTVWGEDLRGHHVTSIVLHGLNAALVMAIAATVWQLRANPSAPAAGRVTAGETPPGTPTSSGFMSGAVRHGPAGLVCGLLAGLLFALHPQHVETTAWLAERKGVLVSFFYLAAVWTYLRARGGQGKTRYLTLALGLGAMLSKPLAVSLPLVLLMLDVYPLERLRRDTSLRAWGAALLDKLPYALMAVAVSLYTYLAVETGGYLNTTDLIGMSERLINASRSVWLYIGRWVAPVGLVPIYPMAMIDNSVSAANLLAPAALAGLGVAAVVLWWRGHAWLAGIAGVHLALLGPVLGIVNVGPQSSADRYAYLPGAWLSVVAAAVLVRIWLRLGTRRTARFVLSGVAVLWLAGLGALTRQQVLVWESDHAMTQIVSLYYPGWNPNRQYADGVAAYEDNDFARAAGLLEAAIAYRQFVPRAHMYLALSLQELGHARLAQEHLRAALRLRPDSLFLLQLAGQLQTRAGRLDEARAILARLTAAAPGDPEAARQMSLVEMEAGRLDVAEAMLRGLVAHGDADPRTRVLLGIIAHRRGAVADARAYYQEALELDPAQPDALHNLSRLEADNAGGG